MVVATGAYETPLIFDNNDLPGVMLGSAVQRLLHLFGVLPGRQVVIVTANEDGWDVAADLHSLGVNVAAIVDEREPSTCTSPYRDGLTSVGVPVFYRHTILEALGSNTVRGAKIARLDEGNEISPATTQSLQCDLIVTSMGWTPATELAYMAGGKSEYNEDRAETVPVSTPPGIYVVGRAAGTHTVDLQISEGEQVGFNAAAFCRLRWMRQIDKSIFSRFTFHVSRTKPAPLIGCACPAKRRDSCVIVRMSPTWTWKRRLRKGTTASSCSNDTALSQWGPCQGAMCSMNTIHLCARANGWTVQETGTTTARPPTSPVTLGALAGQNMEPVQTTPIHQWHLDHGADMMVAGLWLRPNHYGDPAAEVTCVRERVGLIDVSPLGKLQLTGPGVPELLERIYTNQWGNLRVGRVRYGVMCNDEGVVLNDGVCAHLQDETWYMTTTSTGATTIFEWLQWWLQSGWGEGIHLN